MLVVLFRKQIIKTKITEIVKKLTDHNHNKYITNPEFNTFAIDVFNVKLTQATLVAKTDFDNSVSSLDSNIAANKTKKWVYWEWDKKAEIIWYELFYWQKSL